MFCPLASGSSGNAVFIRGSHHALLFDVGISYKSLLKKCREVEIDPHEISGVCISHEHADHVRGLESFIKKHPVPVFCNRETAKVLLKILPERPSFRLFQTGERFYFHEFEILPFRVQHDTVDPVMFTVKVLERKIGICTDLGLVSSTVEMHLEKCDILYIEANHEEERVMSCSRPAAYKQRVLGRYGHLSNTASGQLIATLTHASLEKIILAHLSEECNDPLLAKEVVIRELEKNGVFSPRIPIEVASRTEVTPPTNLSIIPTGIKGL